MSDAPRQPSPRDLAQIALSPFDHGLGATERQLLAVGVPAEILMTVLLQHAASILALIEPAEIRAQMLRNVIGNFPVMVRTAQLAASKTAGGVILPRAELPADAPRTA